MNFKILNQYNIKFKKSNELVFTTTANFNLGALISLFKSKESVEHLISDINLALNGNYSQILDPNYAMELGQDIYFGIINNDMTFSVYYENNPIQSIDYPLNDIKEIFSSWLEIIS
ncbi:hypothetical protein [Chryseobacterium sp. FH1]|uniref:hypothetical protein n=1 Tax=Chryseobacterium sp. FH1 TaxID=1233951 RepID=UPI0004E362D7|nr:hypothetical protein [Chryseobacterium sp. FH1]KFC19674.1 hypothetical protein IO90_10400 [Chryseobacterium sp. FH1]